MNLVTIFGGPRKKGNTATVLGWVEEAARANGHDVVRFNLNELEFRGCQACFACAGSMDAPGCVLPDDARAVFDAMVAADAIVYASPLYMWGVAGPLKAFLDRSTCLVKDFMGPNYKSLVGGKPAALVMTCMGPLEHNADLIGPQFTRFASYAKYEPIAPWIIPGCSEPDALPEDVRQGAADLAAKLLGG
ncbi:flavodoxin family protein [Candidatus Bipolaricaulota bacterium]|nr:flavodoxin family protein [Candidatus Bipolaricaulota bacterium]